MLYNWDMAIYAMPGVKLEIFHSNIVLPYMVKNNQPLECYRGHDDNT